MKLNQVILTVAISAASAITSVWGYHTFFKEDSISIGNFNDSIPANYAGFFDGKAALAENTDFTKAALAAVPAVVHIKTKIAARKQTNNVPRSRGMFDEFFDDLFGYGPNIVPEQRASGSGVLISE